MWRRLSGFAALLVLSFAMVSGPATPACACSCVPLTPAEAQSRADLVFEGVVLTVGRRADAETGSRRNVRFAVDSVVKGTPRDRVELATQNDSAACGYEFEPGQRYRVYARAGATGLCSGNRQLGDAPAQPRGGADPTPAPGLTPAPELTGVPELTPVPEATAVPEATGAGDPSGAAAPAGSGRAGAGAGGAGSMVMAGSLAVGGAALAGAMVLAVRSVRRRRAQKSA